MDGDLLDDVAVAAGELMGAAVGTTAEVIASTAPIVAGAMAGLCEGLLDAMTWE